MKKFCAVIFAGIVLLLIIVTAYALGVAVEADEITVVEYFWGEFILLWLCAKLGAKSVNYF